MSVPFGPRLIGETEKTLNALLRRFLVGPGLTEPQWVTLRLADALDGSVDAVGLTATVGDRARFDDAAELVAELTRRGLLDAGALTEAGREVVATVQARITRETEPIWRELPADDVAAGTRLLNEVVTRARSVLAAEPRGEG
jgi:hypothetical protein